MKILDNVIILLLIAGSFVAGKKLSDSYHARIVQWLRYQLQLYAADKGVGYVAPPDDTKQYPIGQLFMDTLMKHKHATQALRNSRN